MPIAKCIRGPTPTQLRRVQCVRTCGSYAMSVCASLLPFVLQIKRHRRRHQLLRTRVPSHSRAQRSLKCRCRHSKSRDRAPSYCVRTEGQASPRSQLPQQSLLILNKVRFGNVIYCALFANRMRGQIQMCLTQFLDQF